MVKLRIVIPAKNEEKYLPNLLDSIGEQSFKDIEIVVANSPESSDSTDRIAKSYGCNVIEGGHTDIAKNRGVIGCESPLVAFIDADIILPEREYIDKLIGEFERRELDMAGTLQKPILTGRVIKDWLYSKFYAMANTGMLLTENTKRPSAQALILIKRKVHKAIGGYPPYEFGEDSGLAVNVVEKGYKFGILRKAGRAFISPRRLERNGLLKMSLDYMFLNGARMTGHEFIRGKTKTKYFEN